jgi:hypothetical protein
MGWTIGFCCPFSRVAFVQLSISHGWYMITSVGLFSQTWSILGLTTVISRLSTQLEPRSFVRTLPVGAYFRRSIPKCVL